MKAAEPYILFELAGAWYGLPSAEVQHLELLEHVTSVPNAAPAVEGVVFSRGRVVPAVNLRVRFGLPRADPTPRTRLIFIHSERRLVALIVDAAREFRTIPVNAIKPVGESLIGISGNYVRGVAHVNDRFVLLLDLAMVLARDDLPSPGADPAALQSSA